MLIEKLAEAFASFVLFEHVFFLHPGLRGTSHTGRKAVAIWFLPKAKYLVWRPVRSAFGASGQKRWLIKLCLMSMVNENDQADRAISTGKLHALLHVHTRPINVVVFHGPDREYSFSGWFPA